MAAELYAGADSDEKFDVDLFALILSEIVAGRPVFQPTLSQASSQGHHGNAGQDPGNRERFHSEDHWKGVSTGGFESAVLEKNL
jgi:hypothetical protein